MNKHRLITATLISLFAVVTLVATPSVVNAQTASGGGQALEIGPTVLNLTANPGETINATINIRDISTSNLIVRGEINDFTASANEDGIPKIITDTSTDNPYSLREWVSPLPALTLKSRELKSLPITISIPHNASPGGYYAVIRFTSNPPELEGTGVSLSASVGALVILRVNGDVKQQLSVEEFSVNKNGRAGWFFEMAPLQFIERLKNSGNIHEEPSGLVTITDMFGNKVVNLGINQPPGKILPDSIRKFSQTLDSSSIGNRILFGYYHAELSVNYGDGQVVKSNLSFWVIPYTLIAIIIIGLIAAFFLLKYLIRRYNRAIIARSNGTSNTNKKNKR